MPTDDLLAYFTNKKLLPYDVMETYLFRYLKGLAETVLADQYRKSGVIDTQATVSSPATGQVSVAGAFTAMDGAGHHLEFGAADARLTAVPFENTTSIVYHMGLREVEIVNEVDVNPRTGAPEYRCSKETIGTLGTPDAVTDNGSNITLRVDSVTESGVSHAGRTVRVYLVTPQALSWAGAYEDLTVSWTGTNNEVTTSGLLGQTAGLVSTIAADYVVVEIGPVLVRQSTLDLRTATGVCFLAAITGNGGGAPTIDHTDQRILTGSLSDLADITRYCPHLNLKVNVRADFLDSGEDQVRVESYAGARMWGVDEAGKHWLPDAGAGVTLGDSTAFGAMVPPWLGGSVVGSGNQAMHALAKALGPMALSGLGYVSGTGGYLNLSSGTAWVPGASGLSGGAWKWTAPAVACPDGTGYVYVHPTSGLLYSASKSTCYTGGNLPLFQVNFSGGTCTAYTDLAFRAGEVQRHGVITVGSGGMGSPSSNFTNLKAALDYLSAQVGMDTDYWPGVELWIVDDIHLSSASGRVIVWSNLAGLTIRGVGGRRKVAYDDSYTYNTCFDVEAANVRFVNLNFHSEESTGGTTSSGIAQYGAGNGGGMIVENCLFDSTNDLLAYGVYGVSTWNGCRFINCQFDLYNTTVSNVAVAHAGGQYWRFDNCTVNGNGSSTKLADGSGGALLDSVWSGCIFADVYEANLTLTTTPIKPRFNFSNCLGTLGEIENGTYQGCDFTATRLVPGSNDEIVFAGGSIRETVNPIQKDSTNSIVRLYGIKPVEVASGSSYVIGGTYPRNVHVEGCHFSAGSGTNVIGGAIPFSLGYYSSFLDNKIDALRSSTGQNYPFISAINGEARINGNRINCSYYAAGVQFSVVDHVHVCNNEINGASTSTSGGQCGVDASGDYSIIVGNVIRNIGDTSTGGIGVYIGSDYNVVVGNTIYNTKGAAIHQAAASAGCTINGNTIQGAGYASITNGKIGTTSLDGMTIGGDYTAIGDNVLMGCSAASGRGIRVQSGALRNAIVGNVIGSVTGAVGIALEATSSYCLCQGNSTYNGVTDSGTSNMIGASTSNNNI